MDPKILKAFLEAHPAREMKDTEGNATGVVLSMPCVVQWPNLIEARKQTRDDGSVSEEYSVALIIPPEADTSVLVKAARDCAVAKFKMPKAKSVRMPLRAQSEKSEYDGFGDEGFWFTASTQFKNFGPFGTGGKDDKIDPKEIYAGCLVLAKLFAYGYSNKGNDGVKFGLRGIQKIGDGERLRTGGSDPGDGFEAIAGAKPKSNGAVTGASDDGW